ncbi:MAG: cellulose synthase subunit BcsC-related outer membrane protein, partial [Burkholderiales bacterium]
TYREHTRRQGIRMLSVLSTREAVAGPALESWRKALLWLDGVPGDAPLYRDYLAVRSEDAAIRQRAAELGRPGSGDPLRDVAQERRDRTIAQGFAALDRGQLDQAQTAFERVLTERPQDTDAKGGLGIVRLRQERYKEAQGLLEQAVQGGGEAKWRGAIQSATYWSLVEDAKLARRTVDSTTAKQIFQRAIGTDPRETAAETHLADILVEEGDLQGSEALYRQVLVRQPSNTQAVRGLYTALAGQGRTDDALKLASRLPADEIAKLGGVNALRVAGLRQRARAAEGLGDVGSAKSILDEAVGIDPTHPWVRFDLARLAINQGRASDARGIAERLRGSTGTESLQASALISGELGDWSQGLQTIERIPMAQRSNEIFSLHRRLWVNAQAAQVGALAASGERAQAARLASEMEATAGGDPDLLLAAADAHATLGDTARAMMLMRIAIPRLPAGSTGARLQYAGLLLRAEQDAELAAMLQHLYTQPLNAQQRQGVDDIRIAYTLRQAELLRRSGNGRAAHDALLPALQERPTDIRLHLSLARALDAMGERAQAAHRFRQILDRDATNIEARVGAINAALATNDLEYARPAVDAALRIAPRHPQVLAAAGRLERAQGDFNKAADYLRQAISAEESAGAMGTEPMPSFAPIPQPGAAAPTDHDGLRRKHVPFARDPSHDDGRGHALKLATSTGFERTQWSGPLPPPQAARPALPYVPPPALTQAPPMQMPAQVPMQSHVGPGIPIYIYVVVPGAMGQPGAAMPFVPPPQWAPQAPGQLVGAAPTYTPSYPHVPSPGPAGAGNPFVPPAAGQGASVPTVAPSLPPPAWPTSIVPPAGASIAQAQRTPPASSRENLRRELAELESQQASIVTGAINIRNRKGDPGRSELTEVEAPIEARLGVGYDSHVALRLAPTSIDAGRVDNGTRASAIRFGTNALGATAGFTNSSQSDSGLAAAIAYEGRTLGADIGSTPFGFRIRNTVGGIRLQSPAVDGGTRFSGELSRRPMTDSLLSFAGARDDRTGRDWGGVTATGGKLGLDWNERGTGAYFNVSYHRMRGEEVLDNNRAGASGGAYLRLLNQPDNWLTAGVDATYFRYDKNLRYFTLGHGGYFSPQSYLALTLPIDYTAKRGRLSYQARGSVGFQHFRENDSPWFPTDASLQGALTAAAATDATLTPQYAGQTRTGGVYGLQGSAEYQLGERLFLGGLAGFDNARDYRQWMGGLYLRYMLAREGGALNVPPRGLRMNTPL